MESGNIIYIEHIIVGAIGREFWEIYIRSIQYKVELGCQINILLKMRYNRREEFMDL